MMNYKKVLLGLMAFLMGMTISMSQGLAELVYDSVVVDSPETRAAANDREQLRQVLTTSNRAQATVQTQAAPVQVVAPAIQAAPAAQIVQPIQVVPQVQAVPVAVEQPAVAGGDVQNFSKTELMRRERVREEVKNEDVIQQRLEKLRLDDEKRRGEMLLGGAPLTPMTGAANPAAASGAPNAIIQADAANTNNQMVVSPVTEHPGQASVLPVPPAAAPTAPVAVTDQISVSNGSSATSVHEEKNPVSVFLRGGLSGMNSTGNYDVKARRSGGLGLGLGASENIMVELGFTYSESDVTAPNPYANMYNYAGVDPNKLSYNQNVFDLGFRFYLLNGESRFRPYVGGGGGYAKNYLNYSDEAIAYYKRLGYTTVPQDYELEQYLGFLQTGFDVRITRNVSFGGLFRYYGVMSSTQTQNQASQGFYTPIVNGFYVPTNYTTPQAAAGTALSESSFYSIMANLSLTF